MSNAYERNPAAYMDRCQRRYSLKGGYGGSPHPIHASSRSIWWRRQDITNICRNDRLVNECHLMVLANCGGIKRKRGRRERERDRDRDRLNSTGYPPPPPSYNDTSRVRGCRATGDGRRSDVLESNGERAKRIITKRPAAHPSASD